MTSARFPDCLRLDGRTLAIVGATTPIGRATAALASARGVERLVLLDDNQAQLRSLAHGLGGNAWWRAVDVSCRAAVADVMTKAFRVDLVVTIGPEPAWTRFADLGLEEWSATLAAHVKRVYAAASVFLPEMLERGHGRMVNVVSIQGKRPRLADGSAAYAGAGAAINGLTKVLAREVATVGVCVNAVNHGFIGDGAGSQSPQADLVDPRVGPALGRAGTPAEVAEPILFLLSDASGYITGESINVDGGALTE